MTGDNGKKGQAFYGVFFNLFLGVGVAMGAFFIGKSVEKTMALFKKRASLVRTKGLVERIVQSDKGTLSFSFSITGNDVEVLFEKSKKAQSFLNNFLAEIHFQQAEIAQRNLHLEDRHAHFEPSKYRKEPPKDRYYVSWSVDVETTDLEKIANFQKRLPILEGYSSKEGEGIFSIRGPWYEYTHLEDIRASMIEEATKSARKIAQKFADDSRAQVGRIVLADQGSISVSDEGDGLKKKARVVSFLDFELITPKR
jgi:hypothetical protein